MHMKEWPMKCACGWEDKKLAWDYDLPLPCPQCGEDTSLNYPQVNEADGVAPDGIRGGLLVRHGICNEDGSPKKYYSRTDMKRALNAKGYSIGGDTPKPYAVDGPRKYDS